MGTAELGLHAEPFVNGGDDRLEYFELSDPAQRAAFEEFTVVLMTESAAINVPTMPIQNEIQASVIPGRGRRSAVSAT